MIDQPALFSYGKAKPGEDRYRSAVVGHALSDLCRLFRFSAVQLYNDTNSQIRRQKNQCSRRMKILREGALSRDCGQL